VQHLSHKVVALQVLNRLMMQYVPDSWLRPIAWGAIKGAVTNMSEEEARRKISEIVQMAMELKKLGY
jgi:hypothetical protein